MSNPTVAIDKPLPGARFALALLLIINLFNYIDRYILAAVLPKIEIDSAIAPVTKSQLGWLASAFVISYLALSPVFGWLGDRMSRRLLVGFGVILWSLASGGSGLATGYVMLLVTRAFVGVGEAAYGPVAPSILSDLYPVKMRGWVMAWFYAAIPVGSALGYVLGGLVADSAWGWRGAFYVVVIPGILLGVCCWLLREPARGESDAAHSHTATLKDCLILIRIPSYVLNSIAATGMCFAVGGVAIWMPTYIYEREVTHHWSAVSIEQLRNSKGPPVPPVVIERLERKAAFPTPHPLTVRQLKAHLRYEDTITDAEWIEYQSRLLDAARSPESPSLSKINTIFGGIVAISGILATLAGGWLGDRLRDRFPGSYFIVSGWSAVLGIPPFLLVLITPFPWAWGLLFLSVIGLFFNTGPSNTILANVAPPPIRSSAFAVNILLIHILGDAISPTILGKVADTWSMDVGFVSLSGVILLSAASWLFGARFLARDTARAPTMLQ
jgi:MFS family permease